MPFLSKLPQATPVQPAQVSKRAAFCLLFLGLSGMTSGLFFARKHFNGTASKCRLLPAAVYYHRVKKGMPQEAVEHSCGRPEYVEQMNAPGDEAEAWFYSASDGQIQIDFDNGKVHKIHRD